MTERRWNQLYYRIVVFKGKQVENLPVRLSTKKGMGVDITCRSTDIQCTMYGRDNLGSILQKIRTRTSPRKYYKLKASPKILVLTREKSSLTTLCEIHPRKQKSNNQGTNHIHCIWFKGYRTMYIVLQTGMKRNDFYSWNKTSQMKDTPSPVSSAIVLLFVSLDRCSETELLGYQPLLPWK